jgi:spermidine/putrescine transport system permease protein
VTRRRWLLPYLLMAPGLLWLAIFFVLPNIQMVVMSLSSGSLGQGFELTWEWDNYLGALDRFPDNFRNSLVYGGLSTVLCILVGYPLAYGIAFRGGRYKNLLLFLVIAPFFTSFLIRVISWRIILGDQGVFLAVIRDFFGIVPGNFSVIGTPLAVVSGLTYQFLPFMVLPLYVALEKVDPRLVEAANDLYASRWQAFRRVTLPLSMPGVFAGSLLVFIPAVGDFVNALILGSPQTYMIGNVVQRLFLNTNAYPEASAIGFLMISAILVMIVIYARVVGSEELTS